MSATETIGILAGGGNVPKHVADAIIASGKEVFVVGFEGQTDLSIISNYNHQLVKLGSVGKLVKILREHNVQDIVFIGSIERPSLKNLSLDLKGMEFLTKVGMEAMGDDSLLRAVRRFLETEGFKMRGAHYFAPDLLTPDTLLTNKSLSKEDLVDIEYGIKLSQVLGQHDIGQAVVVQQGMVLAVEAIEGTDRLISRVGSLKRKGKGPVLVKSCKPGQDMDMDLPTAGLHTLKLLQENSFTGLALHAEHSLLLDREAVVDYANQHKMFVTGVQV